MCDQGQRASDRLAEVIGHIGAAVGCFDKPAIEQEACFGDSLSGHQFAFLDVLACPCSPDASIGVEIYALVGRIEGVVELLCLR